MRSDRSKRLPEQRLEGRKEFLGELLVSLHVSLHPIEEEDLLLALRRQVGEIGVGILGSWPLRT